MISSSVRVMWLVGWDVLWQVLLLTGFRLLVPCLDFSLESELVFLAEILADVPDGLSVPVIRSGNTGKSRFLEASLAVAVPSLFQDSSAGRSKTGRSTPTSLQSERGGGVRPAARTQCGARPRSIEELPRVGRATGFIG